MTKHGITATGRITPDVAVTRNVPGNDTKARDPEAMTLTARGAFEKLGQTRLALRDFVFHNADGLFVPVSTLNQLRRDLTDAIAVELEHRLHEKIARITAEVVAPSLHARAKGSAFRWSIKVDRIAFLDALEDSDVRDIDEVIIDIARDHPTLLVERLDAWATRIGRERIRLALPPLTRAWEDRGIRHKIEQLRALGWLRWEAANLSAWSYLGLDPTTRPNDIDLATDWSVYVINRLAARQLTEIGVTRFALSPEDGLQNVRSLLGEFGARAVLIVHQDTPMFLAESCAYANLIGGCPGKANCKFESMEMVSSHGEKVTALDYHCRTIVLNQGPFCLSTRLSDLARAGAVSLRADFVYRPYHADEVRDRWRQVRAGQAVPGGHAANFDRGVQ